VTSLNYPLGILKDIWRNLKDMSKTKKTKAYVQVYTRTWENDPDLMGKN